MEPDSPQLLYIHMAALGDALMASPALRLLKQGMPQARLTVVARSQAVSYLRSLPYVDEVIPFVDERHVDRHRPWKLLAAPADLCRLIKQVRGRRWTASFQWRGQLPDTLLSALSRAPRRIAAVQSIHRKALVSVERVRFLVTDLVPQNAGDTHLVEAMLRPVRHYLQSSGSPVGKLEAGGLDFPLIAADHEAAADFLEAEGLVTGQRLAMINISTKSAFNQWPEERFAVVADHLQERLGLRVLLSGLPEHQGREARIVALMRTVPVRATGRLPFGPVAALLKHCHVLVCLNTGIAHVAAALQVPVVVLNGRDGASITPWRTPHRIVTRNEFYPRRHPDARQWPELVPRIPPEEVNSAVEDLLREFHVHR